MFKFFIGPLFIGILAFLAVYFVSPIIISDPGIVSIVAEIVLKLSNSFFENMPPVVADLIASLNLAVISISTGLLIMVAVQLLAIIWSIFGYMTKRIVSYLQRNEIIDEPQDLPPLEMDSRFKTSSIGKGVVGRGLDSIDQN